MDSAQSLQQIKSRFRSLAPLMDERMRRQWAAAEASQLGWGGISAVAIATGLARNTIMAGQRELADPSREQKIKLLVRVRRSGGGAQGAGRNRSWAS